MIQMVSLCKIINNTSKLRAIKNNGNTLPVENANVKAVETAGGCITFNKTINAIDINMAIMAER